MGVLIPREIEELSRFYDIGSRVTDLLADHAHLLPYLRELAPALLAYSPDRKLWLRLARDPETGFEAELWVLIDPSGATRDCQVPSDLLDEFDRTWWRENYNRLCGSVAIDIRFPDEI